MENKISEQIVKFLMRAMENWRQELKAGAQTLAEEFMVWELFSLEIVFSTAICYNNTWKNAKEAKKITKSKRKINIYANNDRELESYKVKIFSLKELYLIQII